MLPIFNSYILSVEYLESTRAYYHCLSSNIMSSSCINGILGTGKNENENSVYSWLRRLKHWSLVLRSKCGKYWFFSFRFYTLFNFHKNLSQKYLRARFFVAILWIFSERNILVNKYPIFIDICLWPMIICIVGCISSNVLFFSWQVGSFQKLTLFRVLPIILPLRFRVSDRLFFSTTYNITRRSNDGLTRNIRPNTPP